MEASSGTSPDSSWPTILSSWERASSKLSFSISLAMVPGCEAMSSSVAGRHSIGEHQRPDMRAGARGKGGQVIASFQRRDNAALADASGKGDEFGRDPAVIIFRQAHVGKRIGGMRVEPSRDEEKMRHKTLQRGQDFLPYRLTELGRARAGRQGPVQYVAEAAPARASGAGVKRPLM